MSIGSFVVRKVAASAWATQQPAQHRSHSRASARRSHHSGGWSWPTRNAPYGGPFFAHLTLGDLDSGLEGAESAKRDETPMVHL